MTRPRILSVGQCGFDHGSLTRFADQQLGADLVASDTAEAALGRLRGGSGYDLVLVNRVGDRDGAPGIDLVRAIKADEALAPLPVMLISNFEWAQQEAIGAGALPGFGKSDLGRPDLAGRIRAVLEAASATAAPAD